MADLMIATSPKEFRAMTVAAVEAVPDHAPLLASFPLQLW